MRAKKVLLFSWVLSMLSGCGASQSSRLFEAWNGANAPSLLDPNLVRALAALPQSGSLLDTRRAWPGSGWENFQGGIAQRWLRHVDGFSYAPPSKQSVSQMSVEELSRLSPAEKYDIFMGRFDYPTVGAERARVRPTDAKWEGLCHGLASASLLYAEPRAVTVVGPSQVAVPFGASDIKALLTYHQAVVAELGEVKVVGERCEESASSGAHRTSTACQDVNAGSFHVALANIIGLQRQGLIMDYSWDNEVWNTVLIGFTSKLGRTSPPGPNAASGAVKEIEVATKLQYVTSARPNWDANLERAKYQNGIWYGYRLELDAQGNIVGGQWLQDKTPDFLWLPQAVPFSGYWSGLKHILDAAIL